LRECPRNNNTTMEDQLDNSTIRHPEWKHCLGEMRKSGIEYGTVYETSWLADTMRLDPDSMHFGIAVSNIRKELRREGKHLSGQGQDGKRYAIVPPADNYRELKRLNRQAVRSLREGLILGTSTPTELLDGNERRRHEALTERLAIRSALMARTSGARISQAVKQLADGERNGGGK
jgi:hypothetical protein